MLPRLMVQFTPRCKYIWTEQHKRDNMEARILLLATTTLVPDPCFRLIAKNIPKGHQSYGIRLFT